MKRGDPFLILVLLSLFPIFFNSAIAYWVSYKVNFIPKSLSERKIQLFVLSLSLIFYVIACVLYYVFSKRMVWFIPPLVLIFGLIAYWLVNSVSRLIFGEDY